MKLHTRGKAAGVFRWVRMKWSYSSFASQIIVLIIVMLFIPTCVMFGILYNYFYQGMNDKTMGFASANLKQAAQNIDNVLKSYETAVLQLVYNNNFLNSATAFSSQDFRVAFEGGENILDSMRVFANSWQDVRSIMLVTPEETLVYDRSFDVISEEYLENFPPEITGVEEPGLEYARWLPTRYLGTSARTEYFVVTMRQKVFDLFSSKYYGMLVVSVGNNVLREICRNSMVSQKPEDNHLFVLAEDGTLVSYWNNSLSGGNARSIMEAAALERVLGLGGGETASVDIDGVPMLVSTEAIPSCGWVLVNAISPDYLHKEAGVLSGAAVSVAAALLLLMTLVIGVVFRAVARSVQDIVSAMDSAEDSMFSVRVEMHGKNELRLIGDHFNYMMQTVHRLMDDLKDQMERLREATRKEKEAEIRALEAQINPHFLYNTLDSINWIAIENNQTEISNMLSSLAFLFRYSISNSNQLVTIAEERQYLERYLEIQRFRFGNSFNYLFDVDLGVCKCSIKKMLFQPFVENAVLHAFSQTAHGGMLRISIKPAGEESLLIIIQDNGKGLSAREVEDLFFADSPKSGIGIANARARLKAYYGQACHLAAQSGAGAGLRLEITIPKAFPDGAGTVE